MVKKMTGAAVMLALCFVTTLLGIPTVFGYFHAGDAFALLSAYMLGPWYGVAVAALSGALSDLALGYAVYAPATLILRAVMAFVIVFMLRSANGYRFSRFIVSSVVAECVMILGYYLYHTVLVGNFAAPLVALPTDGLQAAVSVILFQILTKTSDRFSLKSYFDPKKEKPNNH